MLLSGYSADVEILLAQRAQTLRVPTESLLEGGKVLRYDPSNGHLREQKVDIGLANWRWSEVKGGLAATTLFVFILNWSDFLIAKVMTQDTGNTAPVYLQSLQGGASGNEYGLQAALAMILIVPPAIFGLAIQRYLVRGLTFGAIKR